jgi:bacterioferritin B
MLISRELNAAICRQIGHELFVSNQYLNVAAYFDGRALRMLAKLFYEQSDEERAHALKFVHYLADVDGTLEIPAIEAAHSGFKTAQDAIERALEWEMQTKREIDALMALALKDGDYAAQDLLRWFAVEQIEEVKKMSDLLQVVAKLGETHILMAEAYLSHIEA